MTRPFYCTYVFWWTLWVFHLFVPWRLDSVVRSRILISISCNRDFFDWAFRRLFPVTKLPGRCISFATRPLNSRRVRGPVRGERSFRPFFSLHLLSSLISGRCFFFFGPHMLIAFGLTRVQRKQVSFLECERSHFYSTSNRCLQELKMMALNLPVSDSFMWARVATTLCTDESFPDPVPRVDFR